jgi:hypothetical protein
MMATGSVKRSGDPSQATKLIVASYFIVVV